MYFFANQASIAPKCVKMQFIVLHYVAIFQSLRQSHSISPFHATFVEFPLKFHENSSKNLNLFIAVVSNIIVQTPISSEYINLPVFVSKLFKRFECCLWFYSILHFLKEYFENASMLGNSAILWNHILFIILFSFVIFSGRNWPSSFCLAEPHFELF